MAVASQSPAEAPERAIVLAERFTWKMFPGERLSVQRRVAISLHVEGSCHNGCRPLWGDDYHSILHAIMSSVSMQPVPVGRLQPVTAVVHPLLSVMFLRQQTAKPTQGPTNPAVSSTIKARQLKRTKLLFGEYKSHGSSGHEASRSDGRQARHKAAMISHLGVVLAAAASSWRGSARASCDDTSVRMSERTHSSEQQNAPVDGEGQRTDPPVALRAPSRRFFLYQSVQTSCILPKHSCVSVAWTDLEIGRVVAFNVRFLDRIALLEVVRLSCWGRQEREHSVG